MTRVPVDAIALDARLWRQLSWCAVAVLVGVLVHVTLARMTTMAWSAAVFLAVAVAVLTTRHHLPHALRFLLVVAAMLNAAGGAFHWFDGLRWFDEAAHAYTAFAGMAAIGFLYAREHVARRATLVRWCTAMGLGLGVGWEVVERLFGPLEFWDTFSDVVLDVFGAMMGGCLARWALGASGRTPCSPTHEPSRHA